MDVLIIRLSWLYNVRLRLLEHRLRSFRHKVHFLLLPNLVSSLWRHPTIQLPPPHLLLVYSPIWTPSCLIYSFLSSSPFKKNKKKPNRNYVGRVNCVCLICPSLPQCVPCFVFFVFFQRATCNSLKSFCLRRSSLDVSIDSTDGAPFECGNIIFTAVHRSSHYRKQKKETYVKHLRSNQGKYGDCAKLLTFIFEKKNKKIEKKVEEIPCRVNFRRASPNRYTGKSGVPPRRRLMYVFGRGLSIYWHRSRIDDDIAYAALITDKGKR